MSHSIFDLKNALSDQKFYQKYKTYLYKQDEEDTGTDIMIKEKDEEKNLEDPWIRCVICKNKITAIYNKIKVNENHKHTFFNPHGLLYHIKCFSLAPGCITYGEETDHFTWFEGYTWQIVICNQCMIHLGWKYQSKEHSFFGLIYHNLIEP